MGVDQRKNLHAAVVTALNFRQPFDFIFLVKESFVKTTYQKPIGNLGRIILDCGR